MITHSGARTRAFYQWELGDLKSRAGVCQLPLTATFWVTARFYMRFSKWAISRFELAVLIASGRRKLPRVEIRPIKGDPYCLGRSLIVLTRKDHLNITLLHELVHALGYGSRSNPHNRAFVLKYIEVLAWWFGWDADELKLQAHQWGLI
jgi:hypothetical protein